MVKYENQCLGINEDDRDFLLWDDEELEVLDNVYINYNQKTQLWWKLRDFCTVIAPLWSISSLWNIKITDEQLEDLWQFAVKNYGYKEWVWNYTQTWLKCVTKWWNKEYPTKQVEYKRTTLFSEAEKNARGKNYEIIVSYKGNSKFNKDRDDDGIVEWKEFGKTTYWHVSRLVKDDKIHNSYLWREYNTFSIKYLKDLLDNWYFYNNVYIITKKKMSQEEKDNLTIREVIKIGISNWERPNDNITRREVMLMVWRMYAKLKK